MTLRVTRVTAAFYRRVWRVWWFARHAASGSQQQEDTILPLSQAASKSLAAQGFLGGSVGKAPSLGSGHDLTARGWLVGYSSGSGCVLPA